MDRCSACILPDTFPGITFDAMGVCNYCHQYAANRTLLAGQRVEMRERFGTILDEIRGHNPYDCMMAWNGSRNSTYTLGMLRQRYNLNVLTFTFDNGFIPPQTRRNIEKVSARLGVDHIMVRPRFDLLQQVFNGIARGLTIGSEKEPARPLSICTACMSLVRGIAMRTALEKEIPMIIYGWSPGQSPSMLSVYPRTPEMASAIIDALSSPLRKLVGDRVRAYFPESEQLRHCTLPYDVSPLAFMPYDEKRILDSITEWGWEQPEGVGPHSTSCPLSIFANIVHEKQWGYSPYEIELANMVREGYLTRDEALKRVHAYAQDARIEQVRAKLNG